MRRVSGSTSIVNSLLPGASRSRPLERPKNSQMLGTSKISGWVGRVVRTAAGGAGGGGGLGGGGRRRGGRGPGRSGGYSGRRGWDRRGRRRRGRGSARRRGWDCSRDSPLPDQSVPGFGLDRTALRQPVRDLE